MPFGIAGRLVAKAANELAWHLLVTNHVRRVLVEYHGIATAGSRLIGAASLETLKLMKGYRGSATFGGYYLTFTSHEDLSHIFFTLRDANGRQTTHWTAKIRAVKPEVVHGILTRAPLSLAATAA